MSEHLGPPRRRLSLATQETPAARIARHRHDLAAWDREATLRRFDLPLSARLLKTTVSLCSTCSRHVVAAVFVRGGRVLARKLCDEHGLHEALLENDERFYFLSNKDSSGRRFDEHRVFDIPAFQAPGGTSCCEGGSCGTGTDQTANKTCTVLVEVTDACNLACPVCYSDAKGERKLPLEAFQRYLTALVEKKGGLDSVQLTGGEALLHPEIWQMIEFLYAERRIGKIYLPTNGILLAREDVVSRLVPFRDRVMVLLQHDGVTDETDRVLRGATPAKSRARALAHLERLGIHTQLTMTLVRGVNDAEVGDVIRAALRHHVVKVVAFQPATYSGRFDFDQDALVRLTLSDIVKAIATQSGLRVRPEDFVPIPCSHPNCGFITLFVRRFGLVQNVMKFVDLPRVVEQVAYRTLLSTSQLREAVGTEKASSLRRVVGALAKRLVRSTDVLTFAIKPFMDRHSYDQDRVASCCHHLMDTHGEALSFCEYNAVARPTDPWSQRPLLRAQEAASTTT